MWTGGGSCKVEKVILRRMYEFGLFLITETHIFAASAYPNFVTVEARKLSSHSIATVVDVRADKKDKYSMFTHNGTMETVLTPVKLARNAKENGAVDL